ncbi:sensor histidine kinase KdpD [Notoacmeibacter sp. MSK16QG-6]|uniref:sensor histidine kinase n=1 Tax=Notoacmeibacter sp. MSK16QG-6 TaxID=2957982 RepID=UPI00209E5696|nr:HAMP domain-containing sensor histidine kinase [Notoacmeibacter sp. MSK16QG-6]MCP1199492.1 HAMP domain-containing histidine kinase [Notoacmeibacter sp. MSK16QG-6]
MSFTEVGTADKIIVDRRKRSRNATLARTLREQRDKMRERSGDVHFARTLVLINARTIRSTALLFPAIALAIAALGLYRGTPSIALAWALGSLICFIPRQIVAWQVLRLPESKVDLNAYRTWFRITHIIASLPWVAFIFVPWHITGVAGDMVFRAGSMLLVMAASAFIMSSIRGVLLLSFAPAVGAFCFEAVRNGDPTSAMLALMMMVGLVFFIFMARQLHASQLLEISYRAEKDSLIAELETAKGISDEARRRAEEANLAKSRFLASMSHELRTPLNAILGFSEVMAEEVLGPMKNDTYREYASDIHASGKHLLDLINEILDLSRIEAGRYQINETALSLAFLIEECCHMVELRMRNKDVQLDMRIEPGLPLLTADERSVRQVLLNLLSNAIKFTPAGGSITVKAGWTTKGGQYISVADDGPGIAEEEIPVVLSAFGQGSIAIKSAEQGAGLGLPIVQAIMHMHDGQFTLRSELRQGTTAIASFPKKRVMVDPPPLASQPASSSTEQVEPAAQ